MKQTWKIKLHDGSDEIIQAEKAETTDAGDLLFYDFELRDITNLYIPIPPKPILVCAIATGQWVQLKVWEV